MVNTTIPADQYGLYEHAITGNQVLTVALELRNGVTPSPLEIINQGPAPLYVRAGNTVTLQDGYARIVAPNGTLTFLPDPGNGSTTQISFITAADGTISIALP